MKNHKKFLTASAMATMCLAVAVPTAVYAAEEDISAEYTSEWVTDKDGRLFYYDETGTMVTGEKEVDGEVYLFSKNGVLKTGWRTVGGVRRYYDTETGKPQYGKINICGEEFFVEREKGKVTDEIVQDEKGDMYLTGEKGTIVTDEGFLTKDNDTYYITSDGSFSKTAITVDDTPYLFGDDCKQKRGWVDIEGKDYYYDTESGAIQLGFVNVEDSLYYIDKKDGRKEGVAVIDEVEYYFSEDTGKLYTGLIEINGKVKYFYPDGTYAKGVTDIDGKKFLFDDKGTRISGLNNVDGKLYFANEEGLLETGFKTVDESSYYFGDDYSAQAGLFEVDGNKLLFGEDYKMLTGKQEYNGKTYCFDTKTGYMRTGRLLISDKRYYFSPEDGTMQTGWVDFDEGKYYFGADGAACTGIVEVEGKKYYLHPETYVMTTGRRLIDGKKYYFKEDGTMATGWITLDDGKYYFDSDGVMATGWRTIGENKYFFDGNNGKMLTNKVRDGYNLNENGVAVPLSAVQQRAQTIINSIGTNPMSIYNYVYNNNKYRLIENTRTLAQINNVGWSYFANYALNNRYVVCYYFAAVTDLLFKQAGHEARIVYGTGRGTGDHYWNQIYDTNSGTWLNYDACNGYYGVSFPYLQAQNYTFKQYVFPKYY